MDDKWRLVACGCCAGIEWGGYEPRECKDCNGTGSVYIRPTGHVFITPGGSALGRWLPKDYERGTPVKW